MWLGVILMVGFVFFLPGLFFFGLAVAIVVDLWEYGLFWLGFGLLVWMVSKCKAASRRRQERKKSHFQMPDLRPHDAQFIEHHMRLANNGNSL